MKRKILRILLTAAAALCIMQTKEIYAFGFDSVKNFFQGDKEEYTPEEELENQLMKAIEDREEKVVIKKTKEYEESGIWEQIRVAANDIVEENPELYWVKISTGYSLLGGTREEQDKGNIRTFPLTYLDEKEVERRQEEIDEAAREILDRVPEGCSDWEKAKFVHDLLISEITYEDGEDADNLYGALVMKKCVCNGYCMAYEYLLKKLGISCDTVAGYTTEMAREINESSTIPLMAGHAWNKVAITEDGERKSFYVDVTWDDRDRKDSQGREYITYQWFGVSDEDMEKAGRCTSLRKEEENTAAEADDCSYYSRMDAVLGSYDQETIAAAFQRQLEEGNNVLTLRWRTWEEYQEGLTNLIDRQEIYTVLSSLGLDIRQYSYEAERTVDDQKPYVLNIYL
ncbi:MAG: transglutaminase domain-containing protein [Ruminococcus sp.]|jgi:hypothetical protein